MTPSKFVALSALLVRTAFAAPPSFCKDVNFIVDILKLQKATPFCSSFISVPAVTTTAVSTIATVTVTPSTSTVIIPSTSTQTSISTVTATYTTTDLETSLATVYSTTTTASTSTVQTVTVVTYSPPTSIISVTSTVTSYAFYPPPKIKREASEADKAELEERAGGLPPFLRGLLDSEVSKACSCLSIPQTSTTTILAVSATSSALARTTLVPTVTSVSNVVVTTVSTVTVSSTIGQTSTIGVLVTSIVSSYTTVASVVTLQQSTSTSTIITTSTVSSDPCAASPPVYYLNDVYNFDSIYHSGYNQATSILTFGEISALDCCHLCYQTAGCDVYSRLIGGDGCYVLTIGSVGNPALASSAMCPAGFDFLTSLYGQTSVFAQGDGAAGLGPCYAGPLGP